MLVDEEILAIKINFGALNDFLILDEILERRGYDRQRDSLPAAARGKGQSIQGNHEFCS